MEPQLKYFSKIAGLSFGAYLIALSMFLQSCQGPGNETQSRAGQPGAQGRPAPNAAKPSASRATAPEFTLTDISGKPVHLSDFRGRVVLVDFWATWCPPCRKSIPDLVKLYDSHNPQGFDVLGIALERKGLDALVPFVAQYKIRYPVLIGTGEVTQSYGNVNAIPTAFLIGRDGTIREQWIGPQSIDDLEKAIIPLLQEPPPG